MVVDIIVFARRPNSSDVKTRLAAAVGRGRASTIYGTLLRRTVIVAENVPFARRLIMPAARKDLTYFRSHYVRRGWEVSAQCAGGLGHRMRQALGSALLTGHAAILIGSDISDLTISDLNEAVMALSGGVDAVVGPAADGGYWLIGLSQEVKGLFRNIPWSSSRVYERTTGHLEREGINWQALTLRHDIDTVRDLIRCRFSDSPMSKLNLLCPSGNSMMATRLLLSDTPD